jgi:hypothetical protein
MVTSDTEQRDYVGNADVVGTVNAAAGGHDSTCRRAEGPAPRFKTRFLNLRPP